MKGDRLQPEKRYRQWPGNGQTIVGDRLQPSLTASSMFNAVGQRGGGGELGLPPSWTRSALESLAGRGTSVMC